MLMKRLVSDTQASASQSPASNNGLGAKRAMMSNKDKRPTYNENTFLQLFAALQVCGVLMVGGTLIWTLAYHGSFSWSDIDLRFNFHPILMILGMVYLSGNSLLAFRVLKTQPKPLVKIVHAAIHITAFTTALIGSISVFTNHWEQDKPNLYSLHSWIGFSCVSLFFFQYAAAFYCFLFPTASGTIRSQLLPYHVLGGFAIFGLALMAALTGFAEKMAFGISQYSNFSGRMWWMNITGIFMILFAFLVFYLGTERSYKRSAIGEQIPLTSDFRENSSAQSPSN